MKYLVVLLCLALGFFLGSPLFKKEGVESKIQTENHLEPKLLEIIKTPTRVKFTRVSPTGFVTGGSGKEYLQQNIPIELTAFQTDRLQKLLLASENFIWNRTKRGLFLPTSVFYFEKGEKGVTVFISAPLNQIQIIEDQNGVILDYDPMQLALDEYIDELTEDLK